MAAFSDVLAAEPEQLINLFFRIKPAPTREFLIRIDWTATQLELNHTQLVCALGFNHHVREMTEILDLLGFSSFKSLAIRRNELFATDAYRELAVDQVLDVYSCCVGIEEFLTVLRELLPRRLETIENSIDKLDDPVIAVSYKMEVHAIYNGRIASREFALDRLSRDIGRFRLIAGEVGAIVDNDLLPASNAFFMPGLLAAEKRLLIDGGHIPPAMIRNRLANPDLPSEERSALEQALT